MGRFFPHDWLDVGLHVLVAALATALVAWLIDYRLALALNTVGWPIREAFQSGTWPWHWSPQKHWEAWAPALAGWITVAEVMARGTHGF